MGHPNKIGRRLYDWAVPSIFNFPSHLHPKQQQKARKARKCPAETSVGSNAVELHDVLSPTKVARRLSTKHCYASQDQPLSSKLVENIQRIDTYCNILWLFWLRYKMA